MLRLRAEVMRIGNVARRAAITVEPDSVSKGVMHGSVQRRITMNEQAGTSPPAVTGGQQTEVAVLAGGCFWGVEDILRDVPGVIDTDVGYTGGWLENPTYDDTHDSKSGHAEAIRVTFDPTVLSYEDLL